MNDLQKWIVGFTVTIALVVICVLWVDRPIALLAHDIHSRLDMDAFLYRAPVVMAPLGGLALVALAFQALMNRSLSRSHSVVLLCVLSFFVTEGLNIYLKRAFGRSWPESWMGGFNRSFVRDGVYGFNPFRGGATFTAFPSGHIAAVCAVVSVLWMWYPKFRPLYALLVLGTALVLVGTNFHFLSDVIAGAFLGASVGWIATLMWKIGARNSVELAIGEREEAIPDPHPARERIEAPASLK